MHHLGIALLGLLVACAPARADQQTGGEAVLQKYCAKCHSGPKARGDFAYIANTKQLIANGLLVPGNAVGSLVFERIANGEMPPAAVKLRPSAAEVAALRAWIDGMATARTFRRDDEIARVLADDAARLPANARVHARWFTLSHLANASVPEDHLERYRLALAELLASLTWSPAPRAPIAVDTERTVYRIDLREYGWTSATWDAIRTAYPYGAARPASVPDAIRADWFVATASRPPLYHTILDLPGSDVELARRLGIDLGDDIARARVARAGFTSSGVSINNRVIERHATPHGALWRSYDFRSSLDRENVFAHPLDFVPSGGEIIFNLPDGFQAYMLVDANGRRIDKAPTAIVSDPRRADRAVENGVSCMGCHASGIVERADQLREATRALGRDDRLRVLALHPPADQLAKLYAADRARFAGALAYLGAQPPADPNDEPINLLVARYEAELDARMAASELGLTADELEARFARSPALRQLLGGLAVGKTTKRDSWAAAFPRVLVELGIGVPFTPRTGFDATPAVWIDRARHTWLLAGSGDQAGALALCRNQGFELPRADELASAFRQGLGSAIRIETAWSSTAKLDASNQRYGSIVDGSGTSRRADAAARHAIVCVQR